MGFAWVASLVVFSWAFFKLGRLYQDFEDMMLARRVSRIIQQRNEVKVGNEEWDSAELEYNERKTAKGGRLHNDD
jgi:hypothetical protein